MTPHRQAAALGRGDDGGAHKQDWILGSDDQYSEQLEQSVCPIFAHDEESIEGGNDKAGIRMASAGISTYSLG